MLIFVPLILLVAVWIVLGMAQPLCVMADCLTVEMSWQKRTFWILALIFSLGLASMIYPWFNTSGRVLKVADRVMLSPLILLLGIYLVLYIFHSGVRGFFNHHISSLALWLAHQLSIG